MYNIVISYYEEILASSNSRQLLLNVDSRASTSKSYIIKLISVYLQSIAIRVGRKVLVLRLAPTSVAVYAINGQTLYKLLKLPTRGPFEELSTILLQTI